MRLGTWVAIPKGQGAWQLVSEQGVLARLALTAQENGYAVASVEAHKWRIRHEGGLLRQSILITDESDNEIGKIKTGAADSAKLTLGEKQFRWVWDGIASWNRVWRNEENISIITYEVQSREQPGYNVDFDEEFQSDETALLIILGFFLMALEAKRERRKLFADLELDSLLNEREGESHQVVFNYLLGL